MRALRRIPSPMRQLLAGLLVLAVAVIVEVAVLSSDSTTPPQRHLESIFQDDDHLVYASTPTVEATMRRLRGLGVDTIRATMLWDALAPQPTSPTAPAGFDASNPAAYPAAKWAPYDRLVELARADGITVDFNVTAPGPLWAMGRGAPSASYRDHWMPSAVDFGQFVAAVGARYSGSYRPAAAGPALPRVHFWSIWNEPNQPGWLAPQWQSVQGASSMLAPALYRAYANAAYAALARTGHRPPGDTVLIGELAPEGCEPGGPCVYPKLERSIPPIPFVQALYCLDAGGQLLSGAAASREGCAPNADPAAFVAANPALFQATGFAHHPYSFFLTPTATMSDPNFVPLSDLPRLEGALDDAFRVYGQSRRLNLYLTEYGYETNPPNPFRGVSPAIQARYLNVAQYIAWRDPRVRALSQFLLYDAPPDTNFRPGSLGYWSTFQTGLLYRSGVAKPSLAAYRLPLFIPDPSPGGGGPVLVWAMLRPAPPDSRQEAEIQWASTGGAFRTLETVGVQNPGGVLAVNVTPPGPGVVRVAWRSPGGTIYYSRLVAVR
jgi:hypothetical protein